MDFWTENDPFVKKLKIALWKRPVGTRSLLRQKAVQRVLLNQKTILKTYAQIHHFTDLVFFVDDGYSGTMEHFIAEAAKSPEAFNIFKAFNYIILWKMI